MKASDLGLNILAYGILIIASIASATAGNAASKKPTPPLYGTAVLVSSDLEPVTGTVYEHVVLSDGMPCVRSITNTGSLSVQVALTCKWRKP